MCDHTLFGFEWNSPGEASVFSLVMSGIMNLIFDLTSCYDIKLLPDYSKNYHIDFFVLWTADTNLMIQALSLY